MLMLQVFMICLGISAMYADKPASIFKDLPTSKTAIASNYKKALDYMLSNEFVSAWKWYETLDEDGKADFLNELLAAKKATDIPAQVEEIRKKIAALGHEVEMSPEWRAVLFPPPPAKPIEQNKKEEGIKGLEADHPDKVKLFGKDRGEAMLSWGAAMNPNVARALKETIAISTRKSIEDEGIPVPSLTGAQLKNIIPWLEFIGATAGRKPYEKLSAREQKQMLDTVIKKIGCNSQQNPVPYLLAAHWFDAPILERAMMACYVTYLHDKHPLAYRDQLLTDKIPDVMWDEIARTFFLLFDIDVDYTFWPMQPNKPQRHVYIDFDVLDAYGKFSDPKVQHFLNPYPNFHTNPNETEPPGGEPPLSILFLRSTYDFNALNDDEILDILPSFLKIKGMDVNYKNGAALGSAAYKDNVGMIKKMLEYGADPKIERPSEQPNGIAVITPLMNAYSPEVISLLVQHGASVDRTIALAEQNIPKYDDAFPISSMKKAITRLKKWKEDNKKLQQSSISTAAS